MMPSRLSRARQVQAVQTHDVLVIGSGVGGLTVAIETPDLQVGLLTKTCLGLGGSSPMAQGGVAAAIGAGDSPAAHAADTLAASDGLANPDSVRILTEEGPARIAALVALGARFDRRADGQLALGREAAHRQARILHAHGDATGAEVVRALRGAVQDSPTVDVLERAFACDLVTEQGRVVGALARHADGSDARDGSSGQLVLHLARAVVLATGGIGHVYEHTTNPAENTGDGLAMAVRAGARLTDLEFVQFHPTALDVGVDPMPLLTEALRGAGATLVDERGHRFMTDFHPDGELAPRDVVARALWEMRQQGRRTLLDARAVIGTGDAVAFPTALRNGLEHGFDLRHEPVPVSPAAHYHMGGVAVNTDGRTSLPGLWACGEVACTGVHGANRLASNSLLEGLVFGARVGRDLTRAVRAVPPVKALVEPVEVSPGETPDQAMRQEARTAIRTLMWRDVGLVRSRESLQRAIKELTSLAMGLGAGASESHNLLTVAGAVTHAAVVRRGSCGAHFRTDDLGAPGVRHQVSGRPREHRPS
jgi:L-aspartate oxidase